MALGSPVLSGEAKLLEGVWQSMLDMTTIWCINRENSGGRGGFVGALDKTFHQGIILIFIVSFCTKAVYTAAQGLIYESWANS